MRKLKEKSNVANFLQHTDEQKQTSGQNKYIHFKGKVAI